MKKLLLGLGVFALGSAHAQSLPVKQDEELTAGVLATFSASEYNVDDKLSAVPLFCTTITVFILKVMKQAFIHTKTTSIGCVWA